MFILIEKFHFVEYKIGIYDRAISCRNTPLLTILLLVESFNFSFYKNALSKAFPLAVISSYLRNDFMYFCCCR